MSIDIFSFSLIIQTHSSCVGFSPVTLHFRSFLYLIHLGLLWTEIPQDHVQTPSQQLEKQALSPPLLKLSNVHHEEILLGVSENVYLFANSYKNDSPKRLSHNFSSNFYIWFRCNIMKSLHPVYMSSDCSSKSQFQFLKFKPHSFKLIGRKVLILIRLGFCAMLLLLHPLCLHYW